MTDDNSKTVDRNSPLSLLLLFIAIIATFWLAFKFFWPRENSEQKVSVPAAPAVAK